VKIMLSGLLGATLTGCSYAPIPQVPVHPDNAQVRLTEVKGGGYTGIGGGYGSSCLLTLLGKVPPNVQTTMTRGDCSLKINENVKEEVIDWTDLAP